MQSKEESKTKIVESIPVLTIAGSDCSGGAGIQADIKTFDAHCVYGMSVILSVVAENTTRVISSYDIPLNIIQDQITAIFEDIPPKAIKIGMLGSKDIINLVSKNLIHYNAKNVVVDPVMFAKNGFSLMPQEIRSYFKEKMMPLANILTPNIPEAEELCGFDINNIESMKKAAIMLHKMGANSILIKGGHKSGDDSTDIFFDGKEFNILESKKIKTKNTHGTGCTLSSAIAANLAKGKNKLDSVKEAKEYVFNAILHSLNIGNGHGPTNHLYKFCL